MTLHQVRHVSVSIQRPPDVVSTFVAKPENLPKWATGLGSIRAIPNGSGTEVVFSVIRQPDTSNEKFAADTAWVDKDLHILKGLLEQ